MGQKSEFRIWLILAAMVGAGAMGQPLAGAQTAQAIGSTTSTASSPSTSPTTSPTATASKTEQPASALLSSLTSTSALSGNGARPPAPVRTRPMLRLVGQGPIVTEDGSFRLDVAVESVGSTPLPSGMEVVVTVHRRVRTVALYQSTLRGGDLGPVIGLAAPTLIAGDGRTEQSIPIDLQFGSVTEACPRCIRLESNGVYPVNVELRTTSTDDIVDRLTTHVIRNTTTPTPRPRLKVNVIVPLHLPPATNGPQRLLVSRSFIERIEAMAGRPLVPLTVAPTPETIEALASQPDDPLLSQFRGSLAGREVLGGPYVRWSTSSLANSELATELSRQTTLGTAILRDTLQIEPVQGVLIAGDGIPDAETLNRAKVGVIVAEGADLQATGAAVNASRGPVLFDAGAITGKPTPTRTAFVLDAAIEDELSRTRDPVRRGGENVLIAQHVLAHIAMLTAASTDSSGLVIQIPETTAQATLDALLGGLGTTNPIVEPVTLSELVKLPAQRRSNSVVITGPRPLANAPTTPTNAPSATDTLSRTDATIVANLRLRLDGYASLFVEKVPNLAGTTRRVARTLSSDLTAQTRQKLLTRSMGEIDALLAQVRLSRPGQITVTARQANIPIGVINTTGRHIRVNVAVRSSSVRLRDSGVVVDAIGTTEIRQPIDVPGRVGQTTVAIETRGPGTFSFIARLTTDTDLPLATQRYRLRSTAISGLGGALTVGSLLVLLAWWIRWGRKARRGAGSVLGKTRRRS